HPNERRKILFRRGSADDDRERLPDGNVIEPSPKLLCETVSASHCARVEHFGLSRPLIGKKTGTEQVDLGNPARSMVNERDLLNDLMRQAVAAQPESPVESISRADPIAFGLQDLEIGSAREPAFETSRDVIYAGLHLRAARQGQPRLGTGCQAASECREVARRERGQQSVWSGLFKHGSEHSRRDTGPTSTIRSIFSLARAYRPPATRRIAPVT